MGYLKVKKILVGLACGALLSTAAFADTVTEVRCRDTSGLPSGFSLTITKDTETQALTASFLNRDNIGPFINLGSIPVYRKYYSPEIMGAPITYLGKDFELNIIWDAAPMPSGAYHSHVDATIQDRRFDEAMLCNLTSE